MLIAINFNEYRKYYQLQILPHKELTQNFSCFDRGILYLLLDLDGEGLLVMEASVIRTVLKVLHDRKL